MSKAHRLLAGIATALLTVSLAACGGGASSPVVTVNNQPITHADLDTKMEGSPAARGVLQQMVTNALIDQYAQKNTISVSSADISKVEDTYKAQYPNGQWDELLKARGLTEQDVQDLIRHQVIIDKAIGGNIHVSEKQISDFFKRNHAQYDKPAQARAKHILVPDLKTAQKIEADLKSGKDFAAEAKLYSIDPGSRDKGGELGFFRKGQYVKPFEDYAFSAPIGKISPPIKSQFGYHIIVVEERTPAQTATLASAHDQIASQLKQQQEAPQIPAFIQQLTASAKIDVNDQRFAGMFPTPMPSLPPITAPTPTTK